jgi:hypothetical protein
MWHHNAMFMSACVKSQRLNVGFWRSDHFQNLIAWIWLVLQKVIWTWPLQDCIRSRCSDLSQLILGLGVSLMDNLISEQNTAGLITYMYTSCYSRHWLSRNTSHKSQWDTKNPKTLPFQKAFRRGTAFPIKISVVTESKDAALRFDIFGNVVWCKICVTW